LIDTSPAGPVSDPVVLSQLSDKLVLVVRWAETARELIKQCVDQLAWQGKIAGVAFTQVNERHARKNGRDAYSFYYAPVTTTAIITNNPNCGCRLARDDG
jgi:polysaccharide biosynthesis transport protein